MVSFPGMMKMASELKKKKIKPKNYYSDELQRVVPEEGKQSRLMCKFVNDDQSTKWLNLNFESIDSIRALLDIVEDDLKYDELVKDVIKTIKESVKKEDAEGYVYNSLLYCIESGGEYYKTKPETFKKAVLDALDKCIEGDEWKI